MFESDPLRDYHTLLRATRASGYPQMQFLSPHPYEMAYQAAMRPLNRGPFSYQVGRQMQMPLPGRPYGVRPIRQLRPMQQARYQRAMHIPSR